MKPEQQTHHTTLQHERLNPVYVAAH